MGKKMNFNEKDLKDICNLYISKNITMSQIAKKYNCSSSTITRAIHNSISQRVN